MDVAPTEKVRGNYIVDDVALFILSKLPIKSLKRFVCVHKSWSLLFENPQFMTIFTNNFLSKHHSYYDHISLLHHASPVFNPYRFESSLYMLSGKRYENMVKLDWPNPFQQDDPASFCILGSTSINGTFCIYLRPNKAALWNPLTHEFKVLPLSSVESMPPYRDPYITFHGYGYDHLTDDYKVIRHIRFDPFHEHDAAWYNVSWEDVVRDPHYGCDWPPVWEIYSLRNNSWRILDVDMPTIAFTGIGTQLYMDGMCHWWGVRHNEDPYLVSFDLRHEIFYRTPMPLNIHLNTNECFQTCLVHLHIHVAVLNGSIALMSYYKNTFHISILNEIGVQESWTKLFIIGSLPCFDNIIGVGEKGVIFFRKKDDELASFDLSTQAIEELGVKGLGSICEIILYKESLLSIEGINS